MTIQNPTQVAARRESQPQDWLLVIAAIWLFVSPWVLGFSGAVSGDAANAPVIDASRAAWNAWILGAVVFLVAAGQATSFSPPRFQDRWVNLVLGIWIFVAPWALGFTSLPSASWDHWVIGAVIFILAAAKYAQNRSADVPLASEPGLPPMSDPTVSPLTNEPGVEPPLDERDVGPTAAERRYPSAGNVNVPPDQRKAGNRR
jgi:hypothetical protein